MVKVQFLFPNTVSAEDARALADEHFVAATRDAPGLLSLTLSSGHIMGMRETPFPFIAEATFDTFDHAMARSQSPQAKAFEPKVKELGVVLMVYEMETIAGPSADSD